MPECESQAPTEARDVALCRSLLYQAVSLGFLPPDHRMIERLGEESSAAALAEAALLLDAESGTRLAPKTLALAVQADSTDLRGLQQAYRRLFGHVAQGSAPLYETEYGPDEIFQKPQEMSDIAGFLGAFRLRLDPEARERIDHVSCELEFAAFLARKEAHAIEIRDEEMLLQTRRAMRLFLKDHLARFVPSFAGRIRRQAEGFYAVLAELCLALIESDCRRYEAPLGPAALRLRLLVEDNAPMACGSAEGCPGACDPEELADAGEPE